jgi:BMFP domain-containing protein YqiC
MNITYEGSNCTIEVGTEVTIKGFLVIHREGETVSLDAKVDFEDVPVDLHALVANLLMSKRASLHVPSREEFDRQAEESRRYRERKAEYEALPWYRKFFARRPWDYPYEP